MLKTVAPAVEKECPATAQESLKAHWPEYLMEGAALGLFMISACVFGVLLEHPMSAVNQNLGSALARRILGGIAMGLTAIAIIYSPFGKRSGAHMNPSVTLSFFYLGKVKRWDAVFYIVFQFLGGIAGVAAATLLIGVPLSHASVDYIVTVPGPSGIVPAFVAEVAISALMMWTVLNVSNSARFARYTPLFAGTLVAAYISIEAPFSGMSMNPARTLASAVWASEWTALWIYFTAPVIGMLIAARLYRARRRVYCAKLHHKNNQRCIFNCEYGELS